jgi:hypothetical protein
MSLKKIKNNEKSKLEIIIKNRDPVFVGLKCL